MQILKTPDYNTVLYAANTGYKMNTFEIKLNLEEGIKERMNVLVTKVLGNTKKLAKSDKY